jgi:hypothetical protein
MDFGSNTPMEKWNQNKHLILMNKLINNQIQRI